MFPFTIALIIAGHVRRRVSYPTLLAYCFLLFLFVCGAYILSKGMSVVNFFISIIQIISVVFISSIQFFQTTIWPVIVTIFSEHQVELIFSLLIGYF